MAPPSPLPSLGPSSSALHMLPARTRSQSSAGTVRPPASTSRAAASGQSDAGSDDEFFDSALEVGTPTAEYPERLEELLSGGRLGAFLPSNGQTGARPEEGSDGGEDADSDRAFVYDGIDSDLLLARRAEWGLDADEKTLMSGYAQEMRDVLGEVAARAEDDAAGGVELESMALNGDGGGTPDDGQASERSTRSSSSARLGGFTEHLSPAGTSSPSGSLSSARKPSYSNPQRPAFLHPTVSRLRSHMRHASTSTVNTLASGLSGGSNAPALAPAPSHFSQLSRSESSSTIGSFLHPPAARHPTATGAAADTSSAPSITDGAVPEGSGRASADEDPFKWSILQRISLALYPPSAPSKSSAKLAALALGRLPAGVKPEQLGRPTKMVASGLVCVGFSSGWVGVWDFRGENKGWFGNASLVSDAGPVTALEISSDHTYIAVGHAQGHLYLYNLSSPPSTPARSVLPLALSAVHTGRREGHLRGARVLHVGFVGKRHTAVVSGDERGMAFYHSLGRVLGVDSTDVLRLLGSYPDPPAPPAPTPAAAASASTNGVPSSKRKPQTTLFAASPLPLAPSEAPHAADAHHFSALLTPAKLVVVGLKPGPRTWFRRMRAGEGGDGPERVGAAAWRPAHRAALEDADGHVVDPTLAFSWGRSVRFVKVVQAVKEHDDFRPGGRPAAEVEFVEDGRWEAKGAVLAMQWQSNSHLLLLTSTGLEAVDTATLRRAEHAPLNPEMLVQAPLIPLSPSSAAMGQPGGFSVYKGKAFVLTKTDVRVAAVLSWTDRILALMEAGDVLGAIRLTTDFYSGRFSNTLLGLPASDDERRRLVGRRLHELLQAAVKYAFSEDRMTDGTHDSGDGRGVDRTALFEGLVTVAAEACLALGDLAFLFDDVLEQYQTNWIDGIFCRQLEPLVLDGRIRTVPTQVAQRLLALHDEAQELAELEQLVWTLDPACLDVDQAIGLCRRHRLHDALIFVYNRALLDFVSPVVHLIGLVRTILEQRHSRPARVEADATSPALGHDAEELVPDAYKVFAYFAHVLTGTTYPTNEALPEGQRAQAQAAVYAFLFSGRTATSPATGELVLTSLTADGTEPTYPYLRLLLLFDTESLLHSLDIAFEDGFLNADNDDDDDNAAEATPPVTRQSIVDILLDVLSSAEFSPADATLLHIFVARNLPKYPQFLRLPAPTARAVLEALADDADQSTRADRELAAEYLLSAYTPEDRLALLPRFQHAGFFRILRAVYRAERRWSELVTAFLDDPEADDAVFPSVREVLQAASAGGEGCALVLPQDLQATVVDLVPRLADLGVRQVAALIDRSLPDAHAAALDRLEGNPHQQYGYLRALVEPPPEDESCEEPALDASASAPSTRLPPAARHKYVALLCQHDPGGVVPLLRATPAGYLDLLEVARVCEEGKVPEAVVWALAQAGQTQKAFERVGKLVDDAGAAIAGRFLDEDGASSLQPTVQEMQDLRDVTRTAVDVCLQHAEKRPATAAPLADVSLEDMWFALLHPLLELVHSVAAVAPETPAPPSRSLSTDEGLVSLESDGPQQPALLTSLQALVQEALASLVASSSSSSGLSFPALFKRLIDTPSTAGGGGRARSYADFRAILAGMLDTYRQEGEMSAAALKLLRQDVFDALERQSAAVGRGWRVVLPSAETPLALPLDNGAAPSVQATVFKAFRSGAVELLEQEAPVTAGRTSAA